jgi:hypothetical protein
MEREKQIKEMADILRERCDHIPFEDCKYKFNHDCDICWATFLVEAGYRKEKSKQDKLKANHDPTKPSLLSMIELEINEKNKGFR